MATPTKVVLDHDLTGQAQYGVRDIAAPEGVHDAMRPAEADGTTIIWDGEKLHAVPGAIDDHLFVVDHSDDDPGTAEEKLVGDASVRVSVIDTGPTRQLEFGVVISSNPGLPPTQNGSSGDTSPGVKAAGEGHTHPFGSGPNPTVEGAKLYTAAIPGAQSLTAKGILAPVRKWANVKCIFCVGFGSEGGDPLAGFTESPAGTFTRDVNGAIPSMWIDDLTAGAGQDVEAGDSVLVWYVHPTYEGVVLEHQTICEVLDPGSPSTPVQLRRRSDADSSDDYIYGKCVNVESGTEFSGHTFVFTGATQPTLGTSQMPFSDHGTSSIYKTIPDGYHGFETLWTAMPGQICTWEKHGEGANGDPLPPSATRWLASATVPGAEVAVGERFMVLEGTPHDGLYEIVTYGYQQVMRRVAEANTAATLQALIAHIVADAGVTVYKDGIYFDQTATIGTIDGDTPAWSESETDPSPPTRSLLTFAQLGQASSEAMAVVKTFTGDHADGPLFPGSFLTLEGALGIETLPAGRERCHGRARLVGWTPETNAGEVKIRYLLYRYDTGGMGDLILDTTGPQALTNDWQELDWQADLGAAVSLAGYPLLGLMPYVASTCPSGVTVEFEYNSAARTSWIQLAGVTFSIGGTDRHDLLTKESRALLNQHPWEAVVLATPTLADGTNGLITPPKLAEWPDKVACRFRCALPTTELYGFNATGLEDLDKIEVLITGGTVGNPKKLMHGSNMEAPFYPIHLKGTVIAGVMQSPPDVWLKGPAWCTFSFNKTGGYFWLREVSEYAT